MSIHPAWSLTNFHCNCKEFVLTLRTSYFLLADLCVPMNSAPFVVSISTELAHSEPHLTLEFLSEVVAGFQQYTPALKQFCLAYLSPWLPNLSLSLFEATATEQEKVNYTYAQYSALHMYYCISHTYMYTQSTCTYIVCTSRHMYAFFAISLDVCCVFACVLCGW